MTGEDDVKAGMARLDGYLYWQGQLSAARQHAEQTADQLPWLTTAQHEDLVRVLSSAYTDLARTTVLQITDRAADLRGEYEDRYRALRVRLTVGFAVSTAILLTALVVAFGRLLG
ncbi:GA module-containing protein [Streptomycetaceae bacterium NBC_01309]